MFEQIMNELFIKRRSQYASYMENIHCSVFSFFLKFQLEFTFGSQNSLLISILREENKVTRYNTERKAT